MAILDIILLVCFVPAIVSGISNGFVKQLVNLSAIIAGTWAAFRFSSLTRDFLQQHFLNTDPKILYIISFAVILVVAVLLLNLIGELICKVIDIASLSALNRLAGAIFGAAKTALLLGLMIMVFEGLNSKWELVDPSKLEDAVIYHGLFDFAQTVFPFLKQMVTGGAVLNG